GCCVSLVDDQHSVEQFAADAADEAFGDGIRPGGPYRCPDDPDVDGGEDGVEGCGELGVAVPDQEPEPCAGLFEVHGQVAGLLASQAPVGCEETPRMCTRRPSCSITKNA